MEKEFKLNWIKKTMRLLLPVYILSIGFSSCNYDQSKAERRCFLNQIGTYKFDVHKTVMNAGNLGVYSKDSFKLEKFRIVFKADSTFYMNMKVDFFSDTCGYWKSGACGFENPGTIKYYNSPVEEQFGPCAIGDSFFTRVSPYNEHFGSIGLWFKKDATPITPEKR
ncbi:MAG: hypothetical protein ABIN94_15050 [Ferruginibacter sp.]